MKVYISVRCDHISTPTVDGDKGRVPPALCITKDFDDVAEASAFMERVNVAVSEVLYVLAASTNR